MNPIAFLKIYFCINLLLGFGYISFLTFRKILAHSKVDFRFRDIIRVAQGLILISVILPIGLHLLPSRQIQPIEWGVFRTDNELIDTQKQFNKNQFKIQSYEKIEQRPAELSYYLKMKNWLTRNLDQTVPQVSVLLLMLGFGFMLARLIWNFHFLIRSIRDAHVIRKYRSVRIALSENIDIPFSVQILDLSWVVIPTDLLQRAKDFRIAIKHELQHHRQKDTLWAVAIEILQCLFYLNPAIYFWKRDIIELQEFSCDEALIGQKGISAHDYGSCLIRVAEAALRARQMYVGTTCMAASSQNSNYQKSFLRRRVEMFTSLERPRSSRWAGALTGTLCVSLTLAVAFGAEKSLRNGEGKINPGQVVVDPEIQAIAKKVLEDSIKNANAKAGFAIVADPNTGRVLAVANLDTTGKLKGYWALSQILEPASVIKTLVAAQAIENGVTTAEENHDCENGTYKFGNRIYHDWKKNGWDQLSTTDTIVNSSDICSIKIGKKLGVIGIKQMLTDFGFGPSGTAQEFPMAQSGTLPPPENINQPKLIPHVSAGFGFRVTPLELVQAYGAIANGGKLLMPKNANEYQPQEVRQVLSSQNAEKVKEILRQVVLRGTGKPASSDKYSTAGKTATSYVPDLRKWDLVEGRKKGNFAGFIGFAPVKEPKVEIYVGLHDPNTDGTGAHGGAHAAPVFKKLVEEVLTHMNVPADKVSF